ncbi:NAD(P)-dependent oxidoreductase [Brevundimonas sp.]|uniref:NAD-dependent epimerase/dehydratase family protein n=1 Tax=Brevundimonas sp. TaxID=1871086 RepID=UPI001A320E1A|nr:NAD-dependent epimerase/dehydratase family protein [Brevundimonas sp.]MBJ7483583.1 NAD-dependent epimerase/dehydratase family protein [Brevundimonas sp.]
MDCILITGGAGFIGCELAHRIGDAGLPIVAVDNLLEQVHPKGGRPERMPAHVTLLKEDVRDPAFWERFLLTHNVKVLIHFAAETGTGQSLTHSARHVSVNALGTAEMVDALSRSGQVPDQILLSSSRATYGEGGWIAGGEVFYPGSRKLSDLQSGVWGFKGPNDAPGTPRPHRASDTHPKPTSVYGSTKLSQEHILASWAAAHKCPLTILRFQNVYGPGQSPFNPYTGIINIFHQVARKGGTIDVYEDGDIGRDFVFITDVVEACHAALQNPPETIRTLDVGFGEVTTILQAAQYVAKLHGAPEPVISGKFRNGDVRWAVSDPHDLEAELGVRAKVTFEQGCREVGEWLVAQGYA